MTHTAPPFSPESDAPQSDPIGGFAARHIGVGAGAREQMLAALGFPSLDALVTAAVPASIRQTDPLVLADSEPWTESEVLQALRDLADRNVQRVQMIGQGFFDTITPAVIRRAVLENPAWYTAYTPYQPEISQGRLEALLTFQTMIADLTGLPIAGASLLDEPTAVMEAVLLMRRANPTDGPILLDADLLPQTLTLVQARAAALGFDVRVIDPFGSDATGPDPATAGPVNGVVLSVPGCSGRVIDPSATIAACQARGALVTIACDPLALTLLRSPGECGADIAVGSAQRFGVPLWFGGPHAAFIAVRAGLERQLPGRLVGVSGDPSGRPAYRLALQTREQHIRRERATSNICTAQALLAVAAAIYAVYHGPAGLRAIAERVHGHARALAAGLTGAGIRIAHEAFFDTLTVRVPGQADAVVAAAEASGINLRRIDTDAVGVSCDEVTTSAHVAAVLAAFGVSTAASSPNSPAPATVIPAGWRRTSAFLTHAVFHSHRTETRLLRYLRRLADRDLALDRTMIPLGSCTMKLNAAVEMEAVTWPGFAGIHPLAPPAHTEGWRALIACLEQDLATITGYERVSIQPNAGSQGELAGLLAIRAYHRSRGEHDRDVCLIPASAHGTNAASAVLAGLRVVVVATAADGTIDHVALTDALAAHSGRVAAIMLTYPSTHGVYETDVREVCDAVHAAGGQVYIDGANLNALVGLAQPGRFGGDVSHLNLHKTFCIPHGGGGPGVGPVAVGAHLAPFLPGDATAAPDPNAAAISGTRYGSAGVLPISWAYCKLMAGNGLTLATQHALLAANYVAHCLRPVIPVLYADARGLVAHECILDLRPLTARTGVTAEDVAKRLIDFGFHAPTLSFPVAGTLMVEPTESEDIAELDRFIDAMCTIRAEIEDVATGVFSLAESPLRRAPHTAADVTRSDWNRPYSRERAAFPGLTESVDKYFPPVGRIDQAAGDRNLVCACPPPEAFAAPTEASA